jgi:hypothetical protein
MTTRCEDDEWVLNGRRLDTPQNLEAIQQCLADRGPVIVEQWFYRGSCAPARMIVDDFEELQSYLQRSAKPGDSFYVWDYRAVCQDANYLANGKYPDKDGMTPLKGAY